MSGTTEERWISVAAARLPEIGQKVDWLAPDGTVVLGGTYSRIWLLPDGDMYVYYQPQFWRPAK